MNKKGSVAIFFSGAVLVVAIVLGLMVFSFFSYECTRDSQCGEGSFCGVDHQCHQYPVKEIVSQKYTQSATIFGILVGAAILGAAIILRDKKKPPKNTFYESQNP